MSLLRALKYGFDTVFKPYATQRAEIDRQGELERRRIVQRGEAGRQIRAAQGVKPQAKPQLVAAAKKTINPTRTTPYYNEIATTAKKYGQNPKFLDAVAFAESSYNPKARSKSGAVGLTQLTPVALKDIGWKGDPRTLEDPTVNLEAGAQYLSKIYDIRQKKLGRALTPLEWYHAYSFGPYNNEPISDEYRQNFERAYNRY